VISYSNIPSSAIFTAAALPLPQLPYRDGIVYGPIESRRLGRSLGINICGTHKKLCTYDCVYCQFPKSGLSEDTSQLSTSQLLSTPALLWAIRCGIKKQLTQSTLIDSITLAGNGDPSIHPDLLQVARHLRSIKQEYHLTCQLSIFTNGAPYADPDFIRSLRLFDKKFMKLDAADEHMHSMINRPQNPMDLWDFASAMSTLQGITIQTMVVTGLIDNRDSLLSQRYTDLVIHAKAKEVHLYTIDKHPACEGVLPVTRIDLQSIANDLQKKLPLIPVTIHHQDCPSGFLVQDFHTASSEALGS
jgi:wyosine [tRNA(Phe)-imidazoG37] synthetase (radical SAM superfamily)